MSQSTATTQYPAADISDRRRKALIRVLGAVVYGELKAYEGAMAQSDEASDEIGRKTYRKIAAEELRHHKGFSRRLTALGGDPERAMKPYLSSLDTFHEAEPQDEIEGAVAGYLGEGIAIEFLQWLKKVCDFETAAFIDTVIEDEDGHEKVATAKIRSLISSTPDGKRRAEDGVRTMILRMLGAGAGTGGSGYQSFAVFFELGRPMDLVWGIIGGTARRVAALGISPVAPLLPPVRIPDPFGVVAKVAPRFAA